nr:NEDD8-activating enzyme E1 catalytic subunit [Andalucia godoyi]|eukprot:ANDGO_04467.mRNA.1 hypothetical protein
MMLDLDYLLTRAGPLSPADFDPSCSKNRIACCRVLVIGAGGLGCELLKDLALSGFRDMHVIDLDTIDLSNLNRQFLFRESDVGQPKATVAAKFVMDRVKGTRVIAHHARIQDFDEEYYRQFQLVICGLDAIEPRRWINNMLCSLVQYESVVDANGNVSLQVDPASIIPMIDGGTEGFQGNIRVIIPKQTACFECTLFLFPPQQTYPLCTIKNTPRLAEHCVQYAVLILWGEQHKGETLDGDDPNHVKWVFERSAERARAFGIQGVTYRLAQGVMKNIIPAIASTNAIISAACANEAVKIISRILPRMDNYMLYNGEEGVYSFAYANPRSDDCVVCGDPVVICPPSSVPLRALVDDLVQSKQLAGPALMTEYGQQLYHPSLHSMYAENLDKALGELMDNNSLVICSDPSLTFPFRFRIQFAE